MPTPNSFDPSKAYALPDHMRHSDGRETQLLQRILSRQDINSLKGSPQKVLAALDEFGREKFLMNVGEHKGDIVVKLIREKCPKVMVEVGSYVGYSAILFGDAARAAGGHEYLCLEHSAEFAAVANTLITLAGLDNFVKVFVGSSSDSIRTLHASGKLSQIDLLFLDHDKPQYLPDLHLCEQLGLIKSGAVIAADNVIKPGNPPYLEYVRSDVESKKRVYASDEQAVAATDGTVRGNPSLVYESKLITSFGPTGRPDGVEITTCVGQVDLST